jgi:hypothetical protein
MEPNLGIATIRIIPFGKPLKLIALFLHLLGFSVWFGGVVLAGVVPGVFVIITVVSGLVLISREVYKHGFAWFITTEGVFTVPKVVVLLAARGFSGHELIVLSAVMVLGFLGSRLPERNVVSLLRAPTV